MYRRILSRLPVSKGLVVFESHMGKCYGDSPRAVHEELLARGAGVRCVWSYATSPAGFPEGARLVRRWSWPYLWALARAEWWVDNQGFPHALDKPRHTTYLQTWHGSAYKRMGFDEARHRTMNAPERERLRRAVGRFDHFMVRSEHDVRTLARAYRIPEERLLRAYYPRNDRLVEALRRDEREGRFPRPPLATELGIPDHRTVVLYAPTFRGVPKKGQIAQLPLDVKEFAQRFGDTHVLLVRAHYMEAASLPVTPPGTVVDVSGHHDVSELLVLADVLITDYSSIMFDYALLDRPLVHFAPDLDAYTADRGTYFDLRERGRRARHRDAGGAAADPRRAQEGGRGVAGGTPRVRRRVRLVRRRRRRPRGRRPHPREEGLTMAASTTPAAPRTGRDLFLVANTVDELGGVTAWTHQMARLFRGAGHRVHVIGVHEAELKLPSPTTSATR